MNYLFLLNASVLFFLGGYLFFEKRDRLSFILLIFNIGLAIWSICVFLIEEFQLSLNIDLVSRVQLVAVMVSVNGIYYFCSSYPVVKENQNYLINTVCFSLLSGVLLFTHYITEATLADNQVIYIDHPVGFLVYSFYMVILGISSLTFLATSYRKYPEYRTRIKYLFVGLSLFAVIGIGCNLILPLFGQYNFLILGWLSGTFPALFFAYVIIKHDFMDISVIINRKVAWLFTLIIMALSFSYMYSFSKGSDFLQLVLMIFLGLFWSLYASSFQSFLLTSARRKFIRSWYDTEDVISKISSQITTEKNRESIFNIIEVVLDDVFQLEKSEIIITERANQQNLSHYSSVANTGKNIQEKELKENILFKEFKNEAIPKFLEDCGKNVRDYLLSQGYQLSRQCVLIPFYSPGDLEGIIILGERSNQESYSDRDMRFLYGLVNYISAIFYRLTPLEKLEKQYFENRQKLHEAEIQLIRAQKIESIVHATRQCHHEIRTPLNIIRLAIGRIKTMEDLRAYKNVASEEISRALEVVEETLTITDVLKPSEDKFSSFDVNEVLRRCSRLVDPGSFNLIMNLGELPSFNGVFSDIQVLVTNLIRNSMEAMPEAGDLTITSFCSADNIIIEVEDTGVGIAEHLRSKVWEPYFSGCETEVGNSTASRGWGLTIVNRIVTEHGGTINFVSELGRGTKFTVNLPVGRERA